jgi:hypothetical protein
MLTAEPNLWMFPAAIPTNMTAGFNLTTGGIRLRVTT